MKTKTVVKEIKEPIKVGKLFESRQWFLGTSGNLSAIVSRDPLRFAITASGIDKGKINSNSFVTVNSDGKIIDSPSSTNKKKPSGEWMVHKTIYQSSDAGNVIHAHTLPSLLISDLLEGEDKIELKGLEVLKGLGCQSANETLTIPILPNRDNISDLATDIAKCIRQRDSFVAPAVLIRQHGIFAWGISSFAAKRHVELLTHCFEYLIAKKILFGRESFL